MKRFNLIICAALASFVLAHHAHAWRPSGWVWSQSPYSYSLESATWYYFLESNEQWVIALGPGGDWGLMSGSGLASGWSWHSWPFAYDAENIGWYYIDEASEQWVNNRSTEVWTRFGVASDFPALPDFTAVNVGSSAYLINSESNPALTLIRGETYTIQVNAPGHPFWIKTSPVTGTGNVYTNGVLNNGAMEGQITFSVPYVAPGRLYYSCQFHGAMQGVIMITGGATSTPAGMSLIPAGEFVMGDTFGEGYSDEFPLHTNYISGFFMDKYEVTKALWDEIRTWAAVNGYSFGSSGPGKAANHPVHSVDWYDAIAWCNARSEREGLTPCYTNTNGAVYKTASNNSFDGGCDWSANGYRLPTEAEWEKAARGGVSGQRYHWGDTISHSNANYYSYWSFGSPDHSYDVNPTEGGHPSFNFGNAPYTSPVGSFEPNGYDLYDMTGNVYEWCWDWSGSSYYSSSPSDDPRGPSTGDYSSRVLRGGSWLNSARLTRIAYRHGNGPYSEYNFNGFRCARGL